MRKQSKDKADKNGSKKHEETAKNEKKSIKDGGAKDINLKKIKDTSLKDDRFN